jgi:Zn finger protein HypA/HybF involved in hydrogenase expression
MYSRECKQCTRMFLTGEHNDNICPQCNGDFQRLTYYEIKEKN